MVSPQALWPRPHAPALKLGGSQLFPPQAAVGSAGCAAVGRVRAPPATESSLFRRVFVFVRGHVSSRHSLNDFYPCGAVRGPMVGAISRMTPTEDAASGVHAEGAAVGAWLGG